MPRHRTNRTTSNAGEDENTHTTYDENTNGALAVILERLGTIDKLTERLNAIDDRLDSMQDNRDAVQGRAPPQAPTSTSVPHQLLAGNSEYDSTLTDPEASSQGAYCAVFSACRWVGLHSRCPTCASVKSG